MSDEENKKKTDGMFDSVYDGLKNQNLSKEEKLSKLFGFNGINWKVDGKTQRWISNDDVIEFVPHKLYSANGEFKINGDENWLIWFSQLKEVLFDGTPNSKFNFLFMKDGRKLMIPNLRFGEFLDITKDRKFRVIELNNYKVYGPVKDNPTVQRLQTYKAIYDYVSEKIDKGEYKEVHSMLRPRKVFVFQEI